MAVDNKYAYGTYTNGSYSREWPNDLIDNPFVWVNSKATVFAITAIEKEADGTYVYSYTGYLKPDYDTQYGNSIIFIKDTNEIWARGQFFGLSAESVATINANFNALQTGQGTINNAISEIQGTYVTDFIKGNGTGPFITGFTKSNNTYTYSLGNISFTGGTVGTKSQTITNASVSNTGQITFTYNPIEISISANKTDGTGNGTAPVVDIIPGTNGITYKTGNISYKNISITGANPSQELPAYLADIKRNISDLTTLTSQGIVFRQAITELPSAARVGDAYVFSQDYKNGSISYNKGDMVIATAVTGNTITWTGIEHNIDNSFAQDAVAIKQTTVPVLDGTEKTIFTYNSGTTSKEIKAKIATADTGTIGGIKIAGHTTQTPTLEVGASTGKFYGVYTNNNNVAYVNVPWTDHIASVGSGSGQIVTGLKDDGSGVISATYSDISVVAKTSGAGITAGNNAYIKLGDTEIIGLKGDTTDLKVTYSNNTIKITYVHGLTTTAGATTAHDNDTVSHFNKAVSGITVSAHEVKPTYTTIASYTYIETQIQRAYDHANSVATEAAELKWVVIG